MSTISGAAALVVPDACGDEFHAVVEEPQAAIATAVTPIRIGRAYPVASVQPEQCV